MDEKILTHVVVNGEEYQIGGGSDVDLSNYYTKEEEAFTKTATNGAQMSGCTASGQYAVAEGGSTTASGNVSHAEGGGTKAIGDGSHAEGQGTTASGFCSHAEGGGTIASGNTSHAEGGGTTASGNDSHAEGQSTTASGHHSHAEGYYTSASGDNSHTEGSMTIASGYASHTEGYQTIASGGFSHAEGSGTKATTECEHASGRYNVSLSGSSDFGDSGNTLFTVGNGCVIGSTATTHNALQIMQNGDIYIADTNAEGEFYQKPMIKLQELINDIIQRITTLEANEVTRTEVEKGFENVIQLDGTRLKVRNDALNDE